MKKKMLAVTALSLALMMSITGCSGVADLFKSDDEKEAAEEGAETTEAADEETEEEILAGLTPMEERRAELLKDIEDLVTLGDYEGVEVTITATKVTDEEVEAKISENLENAGTNEQITEGTVADGDTVNIDYVGKVDGEEFSGGSAEDANLEIGSDSYIDGFEDGLIGVAIGDTIDLNVTFPDDYGNEELAGKAAVFTVTVNYKLGELIPAELTDDWVAEQAIDSVSTVDEYRAYVRSGLEAEAEDKDEQLVYTAMMDKIVENATINGYSEDLDKAKMTEEEMETLEQYAEYYGMTVEELVQEYEDMTLEEYQEQLSNDIDDYFNRIMIYRAVINAENLEVDQDEYEETVLGYSENYSYYGEESASAFVKNNSADIYDGLLNTKAEEFLLDSVKITKN